jgi:hypothetical protein
MKNSARIFCVATIALAGALALNSCGNTNTLKIVVMPGLNKTTPAVNKGDVVSWTGTDGSDMKVQFEVFSPCSEPESQNGGWVHTCHVNVASGNFLYDCENSGCSDPELPVGGGYGTFGGGHRPSAVTAKGFSSYVGVYCDPKTSVASVQPQTAKAGQVFQWAGIGTPPPTGWWVTVAANTCQEGTEFGTRNGNLACTVLAGATTQNNYPVHVEPCGTTDESTGVLNIMP